MPISTIGSNSLNQTSDLTINGQTVGKGGGNVATNTVHGVSALNGNSSGTGVTAIGSSALPVSTASNNTAVGRVSGNSTTSGSDNTFIGMQSGYSNVTGSSNVYAGVSAGYTATGSSNTLIGQGSGELISSGAKNSILGRYNGNQGGLDIRTSSSNIVLSDGDGNPRGYFNTDVGGWRFNNGGTANSVVAEFVNASASQPYALAFNFSAATPNNTTNYFLYCYDSTNVKAIIYSNGSFQSRANSYGGISDIKLKQDIIDATSQWDDVKAFQIKKYRFKDEPDSPLQLGVIAQELEETSPNLVYESPDFITNEAGEREELGTTTKAVKYSVLYMKAVKALQEAMTRIEALEIKLDAQAAEIAELKAKVA